MIIFISSMLVFITDYNLYVLGRAEVFREMLELSAKEFWRYSNITCSAYALNALDTLLPDGSTSMYISFFSR